jgi:transcriptional regulator with XRE-family HTH domain
MSQAARIKEIRKDKRMTQKEFGDRLLVSASYISKVESEKETPSPQFIRLIALEFNRNEDWLISGEGEKEEFREEYERGESDEDMLLGMAVILELLKTKSNIVYAHYSIILRSLANIMFGYSLKEPDKALYFEKVQSLMADVDRCLSVVNDLAARDGTVEDKGESADFIKRSHEIISDDLEDVIQAIQLGHISYKKGTV